MSHTTPKVGEEPFEKKRLDVGAVAWPFWEGLCDLQGAKCGTKCSTVLMKRELKSPKLNEIESP